MNSQKASWWNRALKVLPGGVDSPVRAFGGVGGEPIFIRSAEGAYLFDDSGKRYIDFILSWGPMILGHNPPQEIAALKDQLTRGLSFGTGTDSEVELAEFILSKIPGMSKIRLVNSGTEATMSAIRVARGATNRNKIIKFRGCYHGHGDSFLIQAGSGALTHGTPSSLGVTPGVAEDTLIADYNHLEEVEALFASHPSDIAAVIVEPVAGNMGVVPPCEGFLEGLRILCTKYSSVLIFDEVMTGFRVFDGGAAKRFNVQPDMITLGKIVGGGMPLAAYSGREELMDNVSPLGKVYQAGTLSGNPMAVTAGLSLLKLLYEIRPWMALEASGAILEAGLLDAAKTAGVSVQINRVGSMFTVFFSEAPVIDTESALKADPKKFAQFFHSMLDDGFFFPPSQFESAFISTEHTDEIMEKAIKSALQAFKKVK
ncbi:MAG: glutamate-1-semialdehyde 2,1-aminomutase [Fibrobacteraceae bacterium]|nr:glutamate-1-semialdehyde 2,1-aminomutase [Fibrobacteraceae bacterium]